MWELKSIVTNVPSKMYVEREGKEREREREREREKEREREREKLHGNAAHHNVMLLVVVRDS